MFCFVFNGHYYLITLTHFLPDNAYLLFYFTQVINLFTVKHIAPKYCTVLSK